MADLEKLKKLVMKYNQKHKKTEVDYCMQRNRLCKLVDKYDIESTAIATGLSITSVKQHYRNRTGTAMISSSRLDRAETVFSQL